MSKSFDDYFSVQVFLIVLRETLESAIIISVLLAFIHQSFLTKSTSKSKTDKPASSQQNYSSLEEGASESLLNPDSNTNSNNAPEVSDASSQESSDLASTYHYLKVQIWIGGLLGLVCCLILGSVILAVFYILGSDVWSVTEHYWEGTFSIVASIIISVMGIKILRVNKMQEKWKHKLSAIIHKSDYLNKAMKVHDDSVPTTMREKAAIWSEKYSMFILPFVTTLREGMEAIVFIGGIGINEDTSVGAIANSVVLAITIGSVIGVMLYRSGNTLSLQWFLVISTSFLYLVAAGLFSKGVWNFELQRFIDLCDGFDVSETGHGPGSYDIAKSVWHVNCCNGELQDDGAFWMVFTAVFGWTNSATYGSVISYIAYWIVIILTFSSLIYEEKHGRLPVIPLKWQTRRIKKRLLTQVRFQSPEQDVVDNIRDSFDSVNSETPLSR